MAPPSDNVIVLSSDDDDEMVRCRTRSKRARKPSPFPLDDVLARADNLVRLTRAQLVEDNVRLQNANDRMKADLAVLREGSEADKIDVLIKANTRLDNELLVIKGHLVDARCWGRNATKRNHRLSRDNENLDRSIRAAFEDTACDVCVQVMWTPWTLACGHTFCASCIQEWLDTQAKHQCPTCRQRLSVKPAVNYALKRVVHALGHLLGEPEVPDARQAAPAADPWAQYLFGVEVDSDSDGGVDSIMGSDNDL